MKGNILARILWFQYVFIFLKHFVVKSLYSAKYINNFNYRRYLNWHPVTKGYQNNIVQAVLLQFLLLCKSAFVASLIFESILKNFSNSSLLSSLPKNICSGTTEKVQGVQCTTNIRKLAYHYIKIQWKYAGGRVSRVGTDLHGDALSCFSRIYTRVCEPCILYRLRLSLKPTLKIVRLCKTPFCALRKRHCIDTCEMSNTSLI